MALHEKRAVRKRKVRRGQGRPDTEAAVGKEAVVSAVRKALETTPPGEITFHQIAKFAEIDQRLIRYYFGTLPTLLKAVAIEVTKEMRLRIAAANSRPGSVRDQIRVRVDIFLDTFGNNPHFHRLVVDYLFSSDSKGHDAVLSGLRDSIAELDYLLRQAGAENVDARMVHVSMAALCEFLFSAMPVFKELYGAKVETPSFRRHYAEFVTDLMTGLTARDQNGVRDQVCA